MAESYSTKFARYVKTQRDRLADKLEARGVSATDELSLSALVSQIDTLTDRPISLDRDPNLPDIDEMFDNDTLRAVNGGEYKACYYAIMPVDENNNVGLYYSTSSNYKVMLNWAEKIIFSDGVEYDSRGANLIHTMDESGIYTQEDGSKYALVKFYRTEPVVISSGYYYYEPFVEIIDDFYIGRYPYNACPTVSGYLVQVNSYFIKYYRYVGSNNTLDNVFTNSATYWSISQLAGARCVKFEGLHRFNTAIGPINMKSLVYGGQLLGSANSSTSVTFSFGTTSSNSTGLHCDELILPSSELPIGATVGYAGIKRLVISDSVFTSFAIYAPYLLEDLHLGANMQTWFTNANASHWYKLKNVTVSKNAFSLNTSAITVDLSGSYDLTHKSLLNIINNFADRTGMTANILKLSTISKNKLTDEEKAILTAKNWTIS